MKITFGVMSNKWELEAEDLLVGKLAIMVFIGQQIPIAIYTPKEDVFIPDGDFIRKNIKYKPEEVRKAIKTINTLTLK